MKLRAAVGVALLSLLLGTVPPAAAAASGCVTERGPAGAPFADCAPSGTARNILPAGENGLVNSVQFAAHQQPPHSDDQRAMYADLLKVAPSLQAAQLGQYYKDATFGVAPQDVERVETPGPGTVIVRDKQFGVPHIYGGTRTATEFGAGYAAAEDRLFMMDVFRHLGRAQVSAFLGPSPSDLALDCSLARVAGYSESELQAQVDKTVQEFPQPAGTGLTIGQQLKADADAYTAGVNEYIKEALADPSKLPAEYPALQEVPAPWKDTDIVAVATLVQSIFAVGGGDEVDSALFYRSLTGRYGAQQGTAIWKDLRSQNDPEAPTTLGQTFSYEQAGQVDPNSVAMPTAAPTTDFCDGGPLPKPTPGLGVISVGPVSIDLSFVLNRPHHASNALLVGAAATASGHPVAVFGPQTAYFDPEILHEEELHGPGLQARGASFPGTEVYVELGRGVDYAWSATSAGADIIDERAERLCNPDGSPATTKSTSYVYNGRCVPMYERTDREVAKPSGAAPNPPAVVTIQIERTVHGPVVGRTTAIDPSTGKAVPVAIAYQRSTFNDELSGAPAFMLWNNPDRIHSARDFQAAAGLETGTFNWFYVDSRDIAYYMSGRLPVRPSNVDPNFPAWGTGQWEWQGYEPGNLGGSDPHPRAVNPPAGFMTNWNNKPAPGFSAADSNYAYGPVYRVQSLSDRVKALVARGGVQPVDVVNAMEDAGTVDLDGSQLVKQVEAALSGAALTPAQQRVLAILDAWSGNGSHRLDRDANGAYDEGTAVAIMDALYPRLTHAVFDPWLNAGQYAQLAGIMGINNPPGALGSAYDGGWEGYLQRALRQAVNPSIANPYSQGYCGSGSLARCQAALQAALQQTIDALSSAYGSSDPASWTCSRSNSGQGQCNPAADDIVFSPVGVGSVPNIPWVNRPTFQQVVQYGAHR